MKDLEKIKKAYDWCLQNKEECEGTKYEDDAVVDNCRRLMHCLEEVFGYKTLQKVDKDLT